MVTQAIVPETVDLSLIETAVKKLLEDQFSEFYKGYFSGQVKVFEELNYDKDRLILKIFIGVKDEQYPTKESVEYFFNNYAKPIMAAIGGLKEVREAFETQKYSYSDILFRTAQNLKQPD